MMGDPRGTGRHKAEFNSVDSIMTVVDDTKAESVVLAIVGAVGTGSKGDGKIRLRY